MKSRIYYMKQNHCAVYVIATPIGNLDDISMRAINTMKQVDLIVAEDTRHSKKLLNHFNIRTNMISMHEYNETQRAEQLINELKQGLSIAIISDAGTPLISDPGYKFVQKAIEAGFTVIPIPGPCAAIAALSASGLPSNSFVFEGFLSAKSNQRKTQLQTLLDEQRTMIFYEAPHRILPLISTLIETFGPDRKAVIARELTKIYEDIRSDTLDNLLKWFQTHEDQIRGEFVVLVKGQELKKSSAEEKETMRVLKILTNELPIKQASALTAKITGEKKNRLYQMALRIKN